MTPAPPSLGSGYARRRASVARHQKRTANKMTSEKLKSFNAYAMAILAVCLLLANAAVLAALFFERADFKAEIRNQLDVAEREATQRIDAKAKEQKEEAAANAKALADFKTDHLDPDKALHMPLKDKVEFFIPRNIADERYIQFEANMREIRNRLTAIEAVIVPPRKPPEVAE